MKKSLTYLLTIASVTVYGQNFQKEIDEQVWKPFIASFNSYDTKTFMDLHSKDVVRSPREAKVLLNWNEYFKNQEQSDTRDKNGGVKREIHLRFIERISNANQAIDIGIYKTTVSTHDGKSSTYSYYGQFHVVLRKENETWKILVDTDSSKGITDKDFQAATPLQ